MVNYGSIFSHVGTGVAGLAIGLALRGCPSKQQRYFPLAEEKPKVAVENPQLVIGTVYGDKGIIATDNGVPLYRLQSDAHDVPIQLDKVKRKAELDLDTKVIKLQYESLLVRPK